MKIKNLDIVGIDFYTPAYLEEAEKFLAQLDHPHNYGKELWLPETWYGVAWPATSSWKKPLDAKWIEITVNFAKKYDFDAYLPWVFNYFVSYNSPYLGEEINFSERTPAFYAYKRIIENNKKD